MSDFCLFCYLSFELSIEKRPNTLKPTNTELLSRHCPLVLSAGNDQWSVSSPWCCEAFSYRFHFQPLQVFKCCSACALITYDSHDKPVSSKVSTGRKGGEGRRKEEDERHTASSENDMDELFSAFPSINGHANVRETNTTRVNLRRTGQTGGRRNHWSPQGAPIPINSCVSVGGGGGGGCGGALRERWMRWRCSKHEDQ